MGELREEKTGAAAANPVPVGRASVGEPLLRTAVRHREPPSYVAAGSTGSHVVPFSRYRTSPLATRRGA